MACCTTACSAIYEEALCITGHVRRRILWTTVLFVLLIFYAYRAEAEKLKQRPSCRGVVVSVGVHTLLLCVCTYSR